MIVRFEGKQVVIPHGYKMIADNLFVSGIGTEYKLVLVDNDTIKLESIRSGSRRTKPLDIVGAQEVVSTIQFINSYLKGKAIVTVKDNTGSIIFQGAACDLPRELIDGTVVAGIEGLGSLNDIVIKTDYLSYDK